MHKYLIKFTLKNTIISGTYFLYAKNKIFARIRFLKACKHLIYKPFIYSIQEIKYAANN